MLPWLWLRRVTDTGVLMSMSGCECDGRVYAGEAHRIPFPLGKNFIDHHWKCNKAEREPRSIIQKNCRETTAREHGKDHDSPSRNPQSTMWTPGHNPCWVKAGSTR